jgi:hypothetical protein
MQKSKHWVKRVNFCQVAPKVIEESVPLEQEDESDCFSSLQYSQISDSEADANSSLRSFLVTPDDVSAEKTSVFPALNQFPNIRQSLQSYKTQAAVSIQRFVKQRKVKKFSNLLIIIFKRIKLQLGFKAVQQRAAIRNLAVSIIQRQWKLYKLRLNCCLPSQRRYILFRTISIGERIKDINEVINQAVEKRNQSPKSPVKRGLLVYKKNSLNLRMQCRSNTLLTGASMELMDSLETIASCSLVEAQSAGLSRNSNEYAGKGKSKGVGNVGIAKYKTMTGENFHSLTEEDEKRIGKRRETAFPKVNQKTSFFATTGKFENIRKKLNCEYGELRKINK